MNYAEIRPLDVANGPGIRASIFVSGCTHRCKDCFNPQAWDFGYGSPFGQAQMDEMVTHLSRSHVRGLTVLGGEPFEPENQAQVLALLEQVRREQPEKDIWCYSGYLFEDLLAGRVGAHSRALLHVLDVLVDGPFVAEKKSLALRFRGSENQRLIDVPATLRAGEVVFWQDEYT